MRILLWLLGIPILLLVVAAVLIPVLLDTDALVALAAEQLESQSGIELTVNGDASLSLFPDVALAMSDVRAELPDGRGSLEAETLATGVALMPLLSGSVEMARVLLEGVTLTMVEADEAVAEAAKVDTSTLSDAELDAFYALREQGRERAAARAAASSFSVGYALVVGELALRDIRAITVDKTGNTLNEVILNDLVANDLNIEGNPIPLTAQVTLPNKDAPIEAVLNMVFRSDLNARMVYIDELSTRVTGATPEALEIAGSGRINLHSKSINMEGAVRNAGLEGSGELRYASFESPQIDATLALTRLTPALLMLAGPEVTKAENPKSQEDGSTPLPLTALRMVDTRAQLKIDRVVMDAHVLEDVDARLRVVDGIATLDPVSARLHGGNIVFEAELNGRYNRATIETSGSVTGFDVARATAALETEFGASGTAGLTWELSGAGTSGEAITQSLGGPVRFDTQEITIEDIALEQMTCRAVATVNQEKLKAEFPADTRFETLSAAVDIRDGVATLDPLTANLTAVDLSGTGTFDISSGELRASLGAQLSEELAELDPACRINERYTQLRWPVECEGNLAGDPAKWCAIDVAEIAKDLAEGELRRKVNDEAGRLLKKLINRE